MCSLLAWCVRPTQSIGFNHQSDVQICLDDRDGVALGCMSVNPLVWQSSVPRNYLKRMSVDYSWEPLGRR
ncbi:hypothetical protein CEXT_283421 [Caerostris extrusa]|uniref:Uncharacterized protein n=1 Tax=Caerostris extrusa TaxID=172846 RepID=A0AAV4Y399_CAEEX|nr:hypothetical protein CEXT_283421 [Caerostris extrusa]